MEYSLTPFPCAPRFNTADTVSRFSLARTDPLILQLSKIDLFQGLRSEFVAVWMPFDLNRITRF